jgi:putative oxidoreductase
MTNSRNRIIPALAVLLGVAMIGGGAMKLGGQSAQVAAFAAMGLPTWFRLLVGTFEVLGGLLVIVPVTTPAGSLILSTILVGALWAHAAQGEWSHAIPVVVLLTLFLTIFRLNRARAVALLGGA